MPATYDLPHRHTLEAEAVHAMRDLAAELERHRLGQWEPPRQRPEVWSLYNGRIRKGEHARVFPISNWTELDVWQCIAEEALEVPSIYFAHEREVTEAAMDDRKRQGHF